MTGGRLSFDALSLREANAIGRLWPLVAVGASCGHQFTVNGCAYVCTREPHAADLLHVAHAGTGEACAIASDVPGIASSALQATRAVRS